MERLQFSCPQGLSLSQSKAVKPGETLCTLLDKYWEIETLKGILGPCDWLRGIFGGDEQQYHRINSKAAKVLEHFALIPPCSYLLALTTFRQIWSRYARTSYVAVQK